MHLYPAYDLETALRAALENLSTLAGAEAIKVICLTERFDCHYFKQIKQEELKVENLKFNLINEDGPVEVEFIDSEKLYIFAGRQIVTKERLELLALTKDVDVPDGLPYESAIKQINQQGALAVVNWAPGKWFGRRGELIKQIFNNYASAEIAICDTTLRFAGWTKPTLMQQAFSDGRAVLAGSDPFPLNNEYSRIGSYALLYHSADAQCLLADKFKTLLIDANRCAITVGSRPGVLNFALRMLRYYA